MMVELPDDIPRLLDALIAREHAEQNQGGELLPLAALGCTGADESAPPPGWSRWT